MDNSLFCRCLLEGGTPLFDLDGNVPLSKAWFSGSCTGEILYKNMKVGYDIYICDTNIFQYPLYAKRNESVLIYGLFS